jgi:hypothetical protein
MPRSSADAGAQAVCSVVQLLMAAMHRHMLVTGAGLYSECRVVGFVRARKQPTQLRKGVVLLLIVMQPEHQQDWFAEQL